MSDDPTPGQLADFDQSHAQGSEIIDNLIIAHRGELAEHSRAISIAGLAAYLEQQSNLASVAQLLAIAVDRLADGTEEPDCWHGNTCPGGGPDCGPEAQP